MPCRTASKPQKPPPVAKGHLFKPPLAPLAPAPAGCLQAMRRGCAVGTRGGGASLRGLGVPRWGGDGSPPISRRPPREAARAPLTAARGRHASLWDRKGPEGDEGRRSSLVLVAVFLKLARLQLETVAVKSFGCFLETMTNVTRGVGMTAEVKILPCISDVIYLF